MDSYEAGLLHYAEISEEPETLKCLLESFTSLLKVAKTRKPKETPLMRVARSSHPENVGILCKDILEEDLKKEFKRFNTDRIKVFHIT